MTDEQTRRWAEVLDNLADVFLADVFPPSGASVVIDGADGHTSVVADRLSATLHAASRPCAASPTARRSRMMTPGAPTGSRTPSPSPTALAGGPTRQPANRR
jgi:hypothetical protein